MLSNQLRAFADKIANKQSAFMQPQIWEGDFYSIEGDDGTAFVDASVIGDITIVDEGDPGFDDMVDAVKDYYEGDEVYSVEKIHGWGAWLSAPGYMDRTDLGVYDTEKEAKESLMDMYDLDENLEQIEY